MRITGIEPAAVNAAAEAQTLRDDVSRLGDDELVVVVGVAEEIGDDRLLDLGSRELCRRLGIDTDD